MTAPPAVAPADASWRPVDTGDTTVAVTQRNALGTTARLAVWPPENAFRAMTAVDDVLSALDLQASRFRPDSEISWLHRAHGGLFMLSDGLAEAVRVALAAAAWTGGLADPTVGAALISLGYDRDFAALDPDRLEPSGRPGPGPGMAAGAPRRPATAPARRGAARPGRHGQGPGLRSRGPGGPGRHRAPPPERAEGCWSAWEATSPRGHAARGRVAGPGG